MAAWGGWSSSDQIREPLWQFLSHAGMWAAQIPILYVWEKPICSLGLTFLTATSMQYHKNMCLEAPLSVANRWLYADYFAIIASVIIFLVPFETLPSKREWLETDEGIALIVVGVGMGIMGLFVLFNKWAREQRWFHSIWHIYVCAPILLYAYLKRDIRGVYSPDTFLLLQTTAIAAFVTFVVAKAEFTIISIHTHALEHDEKRSTNVSGGVDNQFKNPVRALLNF